MTTGFEGKKDSTIYYPVHQMSVCRMKFGCRPNL